MEDKIQEIMEEVRMYGAAWFVSGQQQSISDKDALYFESKAQGHLLEIQSKLRKLVERCSVREPLSYENVLNIQERYIGGVCPQYPLDASDWINFARAIELAHNITNTTKE